MSEKRKQYTEEFKKEAVAYMRYDEQEENHYADRYGVEFGDNAA